MFQDAIVAALFRTFHARVDDRLLDRASAKAGGATGIGRLSLVDDVLAERIVDALALGSDARLLDLGCGRGFVARWLHARDFGGHYIGVDRTPEALAAAHRLALGTRYAFEIADFRSFRPATPVDAAIALEVTASGAIDEPLLDAIAAALRPGGHAALTIANLDGAHADRLARGERAMRERFAEVERIDATTQSAAYARCMYQAWLDIHGWDEAIHPRMAAQAHEVIDAIDRGAYNYAIAFGTR